jgi:hypothetical protein
MKLNWKHSAGAFALSVAMLGMSATGTVDAKGKSGVLKPPVDKVKVPGDRTPPSAENKSGTMQAGDIADPAAEKGIKDQAVKGCGNCGVTGREAAPPPVDDAAAPPSVDYEEKGKGQHMEKPPRDHGTERNKSGVLKPNDPSVAAKKGKTGWIFVTLAAVAAGVAVLAAGGNDNPASPG